MSSPLLILASASASRRQLLADAGLSFEIETSGVDEEEAKLSLRDERPSALAGALAEMKARRVSARHPDAFVIGGDSVLACEGRLFDKPGTRAGARAQLLALAGRTHELWSAAVVAHRGARIWHHNESARLTMRPFSEAFVDAYLDRAGEAILSSVGSYHLEGVGIQLFSRIEGDLFTARGLPLVPLLVFLAQHGIGLGDRA
jgi:septum formation protein